MRFACRRAKREAALVGLEWVSPMLATLVAQPFSQKGWLFEPKLGLLTGTRIVHTREVLVADERDMKTEVRPVQLARKRWLPQRGGFCASPSSKRQAQYMDPLARATYRRPFT